MKGQNWLNSLCRGYSFDLVFVAGSPLNIWFMVPFLCSQLVWCLLDSCCIYLLFIWPWLWICCHLSLFSVTAYPSQWRRYRVSGLVKSANAATTLFHQHLERWSIKTLYILQVMARFLTIQGGKVGLRGRKLLKLPKLSFFLLKRPSC